MRIFDFFDRFLREEIWTPFLLAAAVITLIVSFAGGIIMDDYFDVEREADREATLRSLPEVDRARLVAYNRCQEAAAGELQEWLCNEILSKEGCSASTKE